MEDERVTPTAWFVVHIMTGFMLATIAVLAMERFGAPSLMAVFIMGWIGHALFDLMLNWVVTSNS